MAFDTETGKLKRTIFQTPNFSIEIDYLSTSFIIYDTNYIILCSGDSKCLNLDIFDLDSQIRTLIAFQ